MHAYAIQDATGMVKLDAMENPFTPAARAAGRPGRAPGRVAINRYPGARIDDLQAGAGRYAGPARRLRPDAGQRLRRADLAAGHGLRRARRQHPRAAARLRDVRHERAAAGLASSACPHADFELDEAAMLAAMRQHQPAITYLAYPNNPTANLWDAR
jgi:histidinol-phosphate aminotransferase